MYRIPIEEWSDRAKEVLKNMEPDPTLANQAFIDELFRLHNDLLKPLEYSRHCNSCIRRVHGKVIEHVRRLDLARTMDSSTDAI